MMPPGHLSSLQLKVAWLLAHPELWQGQPFDQMTRLPRRTTCNVTALPPTVVHVVKRWHVIVAGLKREGLVSRRTYAGDVRVPVLVRQARKTLARQERQQQRPS